MQRVYRGILVLVLELVGYGSNENRLSVLVKVNWMVFHSFWKHLHQREVLEIHQFSEPWQ